MTYVFEVPEGAVLEIVKEKFATSHMPVRGLFLAAHNGGASGAAASIVEERGVVTLKLYEKDGLSRVQSRFYLRAIPITEARDRFRELLERYRDLVQQSRRSMEEVFGVVSEHFEPEVTPTSTAPVAVKQASPNTPRPAAEKRSASAIEDEQDEIDELSRPAATIADEPEPALDYGDDGGAGSTEFDEMAFEDYSEGWKHSDR